MELDKLYINGDWQYPRGGGFIDVENPANKEIFARVAMASKEDVAEAVACAKKSFNIWKNIPLRERIAYVEKFIENFENKKEEIQRDIIRELGVSKWFSKIHVNVPLMEMKVLLEDVKELEFEKKLGNAWLVKEPFGPVACICPWNYPALQITRKIIPALLTGNTVVVKPASYTPLAAWHIADCIHRAGFPKGVFNLVSGPGTSVGDCLCSNKDIRVISFTGSEKIGRDMYRYGAGGIKHLILELGGKSAGILLPSASMKDAIKGSLASLYPNSGQTCSAISRLFIPRDRLEEFKDLLEDIYISYKSGDPYEDGVKLGPLVSKNQYDRVKKYIEKGIEEGAVLYKGEVPEDDSKGYFVKPAVFIGVDNKMTIAQEEIFGPVLCVILYDRLDEAVKMANDSIYGLSGAIYGDREEAMKIARKLDTGNITINKAYGSGREPFGGYKSSGLGRENGIYGLEEFLQLKAVFVDK